MSFATAAARFATQAATERAETHAVSVTPCIGCVAQPALTVSLGHVRAQRELTDSGFTIVRRAPLRVPAGLSWTPAAGHEFLAADSGLRFRIRSATTSRLSGETACECIVID